MEGFDWFYLLLLLFFPVMIVAAWWKNRSRRSPLDEISEPIEARLAELRAAENEVRGNPMELRERLLQNHVLLDRFPTTRGYSTEFMDQLVNELRERGIAAETYFQETMPIGAGFSVVSAQGIFELYVARDRADEAAAFIKSRP